VREWKTTSARYPEQSEGLTSLDLQLVCYSWITGISDVAIVAFVRKRVPEIQYLLASITDEQRRELGQVVEATARQIETAQFPPRPGIRLPRTGASAAPISDYALETSHWWGPNSFVNRERATWIGLTCLTTKWKALDGSEAQSPACRVRTLEDRGDLVLGEGNRPRTGFEVRRTGSLPV